MHAFSDLMQNISDECDQYGLNAPREALPKLTAYLWHLREWNTKLNLTRHTTVKAFVNRDMADSVALINILENNERVLDVGTGGGVPGVLLAILRPDLRVELCDSVTKKARSVQAIVNEIGINIPVHVAAGQKLVSKYPNTFDTLVIRAVAPLTKLLSWFEPVSHTFGRILLIKGPRWETEKQDARHRGFIKKVQMRRLTSWPIPDSNNESVLLEIRRRD